MGDAATESAETRRAEVVVAAAGRFEHAFGRPPKWIAAAPGRVNLIGEHTDYNDGFVLPLAIDRWAVVAADHAAGQTSTLIAADLDRTCSFDGPAPASPIEDERWANCLLGVMHELHAAGASVSSMDVLLTSTVPIGAGLSSSAAIEVATASVCSKASDYAISEVEAAQLCMRAEHAFTGTPCGIMDMLVSAGARAGHAMLIDCRDHQVGHVPLPPEDEAAILVIDTGIKHDLAASEYAERRTTCQHAAAKLGLASLREATLAMLELEDLNSIERKRASHVITENTRTLLAARALEQGDLTTLGDLMFAGHESLRELYAVSCPELDLIVDEALRMREAGVSVFGARMTGGGFGGCAIVLCRPDAANVVNSHIGGSFEQSFGRMPAVSRVFATGGCLSVTT